MCLWWDHSYVGILWRPLKMEINIRTAVIGCFNRLNKFCVDAWIELENEMWNLKGMVNMTPGITVLALVVDENGACTEKCIENVHVRAVPNQGVKNSKVTQEEGLSLREFSEKRVYVEIMVDVKFYLLVLFLCSIIRVIYIFKIIGYNSIIFIFGSEMFCSRDVLNDRFTNHHKRTFRQLIRRRSGKVRLGFAGRLTFSIYAVSCASSRSISPGLIKALIWLL